MLQKRNPTTVSQLFDSNSGYLQNKINSLSDAREFLRSWNSEQLWSDQRSQPTICYSESQNHALPRFWIAAWLHGILCVLQETFLNDYLHRQGRTSTLFNNSKNLASSSRGLTWDYKKNKGTWKGNETGTAEFVKTCTTLPKGRWIVKSYWWDSFSQWYDWLYEISNLGIASVKFPDSMEFQSWKVNFRSEVCLRTAEPQITTLWIKEVEKAKSIDELMTSRSIVGRSDSPDSDMLDAIASALKRLLDKHNHFRKSQVSKSSVLKNTNDSHVGDKMLAWSTSISVQPQLMKQYKDSLICSVYVCRKTTSKTSTFDGIKLHHQQAICLQMWSWKDCANQNCRTLFNFRLSWLCTTKKTVRNNGKTSYLPLTTSVKSHIDQLMRTRNSRVQNEVVERGTLRCEESGREFSVEGTGTMFEKRLM